MGVGFVLQVIWALALVALLLVGLAYLARTIQRGRIVGGSRGGRLVTTIESTVLAQNVTVHVVKVAGSYYLIGGGTAGLSLLSEIPAGEIEPYIDAQRQALAVQRATLMRPFARFRKS